MIKRRNNKNEHRTHQSCSRDVGGAKAGNFGYRQDREQAAGTLNRRNESLPPFTAGIKEQGDCTKTMQVPVHSERTGIFNPEETRNQKSNDLLLRFI